ncbi:Molybdate-anion transporter [Seminavis robusta]|uniref:Molybdate-anion transporter n=1 Tax=Seminavis robusta TaxID=568900 RepID=A0A9N8H975_9STRA|nr:Molybdate-anion transporter [Seminavis robusta]|eukprot:Sro245_g097520.1 Molybdate-anion transporter (489) ;mRNA; f:67651-69339
MVSRYLGPAKAFLPDWPEWAVDILLVMTGMLTVTYGVTSFFHIDDESEENTKEESTKENGNGKAKKNRHELHEEFDVFRRQYMIVYLVIMLADWMQGTHMYTLYLSYNVNISALFLTGFLSGAIFAPFLGSAVDKFGRKRSCIVYCVLEIIINTMEHSQNFTILLIGRVLGGISTNLLFSAFESWMTTEHRKKGFPEEWLSRTYSESSVGNGVMAVLAGIVAQVLEDNLGHIGPFQGAIALTALALFLILRWDENYGEEHAGDHSKSSLYHQFIEGWSATVSDSRIWRIGMTQALSEGAMYTFVFMWVPTLLSLDPPGGLPTGCVFSALMMAISCGGMMFPPLYMVLSKYVVSKANAAEVCASLVYLLASICMVIPAMCLSLSQDNTGFFTSIVASFMLVEFCVGLFMPLAGTLRSKYVPDALQGGILNIFRLPLNAIVVSGTYATDVMAPADVFKLVSASFWCAAVLQATMVFTKKEDVKSDHLKKE